MDWTAIILGGIGGGLGALLGSLLALPFKSQTAKSTIGVAFVVAGVTLGSQFAPALLDPYIGSFLRDSTGQTAAVDRQLDDLRAEPIFAVLLENRPELEEEVRTRLLEAYRLGGNDGLTREAGDIGQQYLGQLFVDYLPRTSDEDITMTITVMTDIMNHLAIDDPELCYLWLFGAQHGELFDVVEFNRRIGAQRLERLTAALTSVIENVHDAIPDYDREAAQLGVQEAAAVASARFTTETVGVITGERPAEDRQEAKLACEGMSELYERALALENAADVVRELLRR